MKDQLTNFGGVLAVFASLTLAANAATVVPVTAISGHNNRDNFGGNLGDLTSGEEMAKGNVNDPSTWTTTTNGFATQWQAWARLDSGTSNNGKIGWAALDFGTTTVGLQNLYLWNVRDNPTTRGVNEYNIYYANTLGAALPAAPTSNTGTVDYTFSGANGWTKFNASLLTLATANTTIGSGAEGTIALGGISARYVAIEIISAKGVDAAGRVGLGEMAVTVIPEPSSFLLGGLGALLLLRRRR